MPKNFADFERKFGWKAANALDLVGRTHGSLLPEVSEGMLLGEDVSRNELMLLAKRYVGQFRRNPEKTHVFPLLGTQFQFEFARGVRDAYGLKTRLRTMAFTKIEDDAWLLEHREIARKLRLRETGIVIHDYVESGMTVHGIMKASDVPASSVKVHRLSRSKVEHYATVPLLGDKTKTVAFSWHEPSKYRIFNKVGPTIRDENRSALTKKEKAFVRRAAYAAGVAAARELIEKEKKKV